MKMINLALAASAFALISASAFAAASKTYQVTGPILEVTDTTITVEKGKEKWTVERDATTQVTGGELKVGNKVTISYRMVAVTAEVKGGKAEAAAPAEKKAKKK
jgi:type 1 fimbria pilin